MGNFSTIVSDILELYLKTVSFRGKTLLTRHVNEQYEKILSFIFFSSDYYLF